MSDTIKCDMCGERETDYYASKFVFNKANWGGGKDRYTLCHKCGDKVRGYIESKVQEARNHDAT